MQRILMTRRDPFGEFSDQLGKLIGEMQSRTFHKFSARRGWMPAVNLYETQTAFLVCADLAGMSADQIDVTTEERLLRISGTRPNPSPRGGDDPSCVHLMEIDGGDFEREVEIPDEVDCAAIEASYVQGFLWVRMPKAANRE